MDSMPRRNPLQVSIEDAVLDVIADEVRATEHQARQEARQREAEAEAAAVLADPLAPLRERLGEIDEQLAKLDRMHRRQGDALAGRLIGTLERERAGILARLGGNGQSGAKSRAEA
jgi:hypothetical protein